jgi:type II secretory pathway pseudopilin PulG
VNEIAYAILNHMRYRASKGYTILEAMLFITISSSMFVLAMISFSGRQQKVQFTQAVRELDAKIQDVINDVTTGYFPSDGSIQCTVDATQSRPRITNASTQNGQGTNDSCVFVGKALQFFPEDGDDSTENQTLLYGYSLVGRRTAIAGGSPQNLEDAKPVTTSPVAPNGTNDVTEKSDLKFGLRVTRVATETATPVDSGVIAFLTRFTRTFSTTEFSEGQTVSSALVPGTSESSTQYTAANSLNTITDLATAIAPDTYVDTSSTVPIVVCLADNSLNQRASITIGGTGQASTRVDIDTYNKDICDA